MSHTQITYSVVLALLCSINIQTSTSVRKKSLPAAVQEWDKLTVQQSLASRTKNLRQPCLRDATRSCAMCSFIALLSCTKCPQAGPCIHLVPQALTCGYYVGLSYFTCKKECCDKPAQTRRERSALTRQILQKYSVDTIQGAIPCQHPLWLAAQNHQKMS